MKKSLSLAAVVLLSMAMITAYGAGRDLSITADSLMYNGESKIVTASGNVVIDDGINTIKGQEGTYNTATKETSLQGNVAVSGPDLTGHAQSIHMYGNEKIVASGGVYIKKGVNALEGQEVTYNLQNGYGTMAGGGLLTTDRATMSAGHIEAWLQEVRAVGTGNVELKSSADHLYARGNRIDYRQTPGSNDGVAYLSGNAYAEQNGNTLQGPALEIQLQDNSIETKGRSTLVIRSDS